MSELAGIFSGMSQYPDSRQVVDDLGDKFLVAFVKALEATRKDLADLQDFRPQWFINFSKRFVANFIHERMWDHTVTLVDSHPDVNVVDQEPTRQIHFGVNYVLRFKRHTEKLLVRSFPTSGAIAFWTNRAAPALPGMELWSLALGYIWDAETGEIGDAILSFRDGKDKPVWSFALRPADADAPTAITLHPMDPQLPQYDLSNVVNDEDAEGTTDTP